MDSDEIFRDQLILHRVARQDLPTETIAVAPSPSIYLEVDDRTISVYMQAMVVLKKPDERNRRVRDDLIRAYTKTY